jgi:hypothetical protein
MRNAVRRGILLQVLALGAGIAAVSVEAATGKAVTVTGRVVDNVCWLTMGLIGEGHRECAIGCDKAGVRMALLDEKANVLYTLMADKPFVDPNALIRPHFERVVTVKGDLYDAPGGQRVLAVKEVAAEPSAANPCAAKNPCAVQNPCAAKNPCAATAANNPCAMTAVKDPSPAHCAGAWDPVLGSNFGACP